MADIVFFGLGYWSDRIDGRLCHRPWPRVRLHMFEPLLGLIVALGLGVYLVLTLLMPERF